jgi:hypothetical protein
MAGRTNKSGLDYFPFNVDFFQDDKIEFVTARFDEKGEIIAIKLLCLIYKNGYYYEWNEDTALLFSKRAGRNVSPSCANEVVNELVKRGFFDKSLFNSLGVLTSKGIQRRFLQAISERKEVEIISNYWLLDVPKNTKNTTFSISLPINSISLPINEQSKVKKSKVKKSISPPLPPSEEVEVKKTWRDDFNIYFSECKKAFNAAFNDEIYISHREMLNPKLDVVKTLQTAFYDFWGTEKGWDWKKKEKGYINWRATITNSLKNTQNKVWK